MLLLSVLMEWLLHVQNPGQIFPSSVQRLKDGEEWKTTLSLDCGLTSSLLGSTDQGAPTMGASCSVVLPREEQNLSQAYPLSTGCSACFAQKLLRSLSGGEGNLLSLGQDPGQTPGGWGQLPLSLALGMLGWQPGLFFLSIWVQPMNFQPNQPNHVLLPAVLLQGGNTSLSASDPKGLPVPRCCHYSFSMISALCQICLIRLKETFGLPIPKINGSTRWSVCWVWFRSNHQALKCSWKGSGSEPQTTGTLLCLLGGLFAEVEGSISSRTGICNSPHCPSWGKV